MKLKYERFDGLGCMAIRGVIDANQFKLLVVGLESLVNDLEETLLVNLSNAVISDPNALKALAEIKKKLMARAQQKIYWIHKDRSIGDFPTTDLFIARLSGSKFRQIGDRIKLDDQLYALAEEAHLCEARILELGGDEQNAQRVILENKVLRAQKRILEESVAWQDKRIKTQAHIAASDPDHDQKAAETLKALNDGMKTAFGTEVDV